MWAQWCLPWQWLVRWKSIVGGLRYSRVRCWLQAGGDIQYLDGLYCSRREWKHVIATIFKYSYAVLFKYVPIEVFTALSSLTAGVTKGLKLWLGCLYCHTEQDAEASKQESITGGHLLRGRDKDRDRHLVVVEVQGEVPKCRRVQFNIHQMVMWLKPGIYWCWDWRLGNILSGCSSMRGLALLEGLDQAISRLASPQGLSSALSTPEWCVILLMYGVLSLGIITWGNVLPLWGHCVLTFTHLSHFLPQVVPHCRHQQASNELSLPKSFATCPKVDNSYAWGTSAIQDLHASLMALHYHNYCLPPSLWLYDPQKHHK